MKVILFCHSLRSDWNHGNAHFLRGIVSELVHRGIEVRAFEPVAGWSAANLAADHGLAALDAWRVHYPELAAELFDPSHADLDALLDGADLVLVHEWTEPELVAQIGRHHRAQGGYALLFHDTHHRMVSDPDAMRRFDLDGYDGVLAFGAVLARLYERSGWGDRVFIWHEAADLRRFRPWPDLPRERDLVWIGNWGDDERAAELAEFAIDPVAALALNARFHGVRYPEAAVEKLSRAGIEFGGYTPNALVPPCFAAARVTVHVPRRPYVRLLPGIPTIRVFEALACGIPLVSAPWDDIEGLFRPGEDYLVAFDGAAMRRQLRSVIEDPARAAELARQGRQTIEARHTCAHRVDELMRISRALGIQPTDGVLT
jgi:spore maturation protein CgeB